jgi:putative ABC transport system ATP-binding protein
MQPQPAFNDSTLIDLRSVYKTYETPAGPIHALRGIDLQVDSGELVGIVGPSGSGKSTLLNLLAAIDRPSSGRVRLGGTEVQALSENLASLWRGETVGIVFQFFQLLPTLTALENVMLPMDFRARLRPHARRERALALLEGVGVAAQADRLPEAMSGGQRQRVAIARALANDPPILLADEPTGNLDSVTSRAVLDLFAELAADGRTVVMVTHEPQIAAIATRTLTLVDGALTADVSADRGSEPADRRGTQDAPATAAPGEQSVGGERARG